MCQLIVSIIKIYKNGENRSAKVLVMKTSFGVLLRSKGKQQSGISQTQEDDKRNHR